MVVRKIFALAKAKVVQKGNLGRLAGLLSQGKGNVWVGTIRSRRQGSREMSVKCSD